MDTVKQRMQLQVKPYANVVQCVRRVYALEGARAFWAGYTTTIAMNVPYAAVYFATYESCVHVAYKRERARRGAALASDAENEYSPLIHLGSGAGAGFVAAAVTNPFDVAKTRLQTGQGGYTGFRDAIGTIYRTEGSRGLAKGVVPRVMFHTTSGAIMLSVYEFVKELLR